MIRERDHRRILWLWTVLAAMVVAVTPAGVYLFYQNACLEVSYQVSALDAEHELLLEEERRLRVERARQVRLERIETWARREQGLVRPDPESVFVVGPDPPVATGSPARQASTISDGSLRTAAFGEVSSIR